MKKDEEPTPSVKKSVRFPKDVAAELEKIADWFEAFEKEAISIYLYINISSTCISIKCF